MELLGEECKDSSPEDVVFHLTFDVCLVYIGNGTLIYIVVFNLLDLRHYL